jgi:hypothetical protein
MHACELLSARGTPGRNSARLNGGMGERNLRGRKLAQCLPDGDSIILICRHDRSSPVAEVRDAKLLAYVEVDGGCFGHRLSCRAGDLGDRWRLSKQIEARDIIGQITWHSSLAQPV